MADVRAHPGAAATSGGGRAARARPFGDDIRAALPPWLAARGLLLLALAIAWYVRNRTGVALPDDAIGHGRRGLLSWDGWWYEAIATDGYPGPDGTGLEGLRFFPLFPAAAGLLGAVAGGPGVALLVVANAGALVAGAAVHRLALQVSGRAESARRATWIFTLAPPAFVLGMGYADGPAAAITAAALLAILAGRWPAAAALGLLAGLIRPTGLLLAVPAGIETMRRARRRGSLDAMAMVAVAAPAAGTGLYLLWVEWRFGDWLLPYRAQQVPGLRGDLTNPFLTVGRSVASLLGGDLGRDARHLVVLAGVVLLVVAWRRLPLALAAYATGAVVIALATQHLGSVERYLWNPVVLVVAATAAVPSGRHRRGTYVALLAASSALFVFLAVRAFLGIDVP